jgi:uncharacterized membrane protein YbhN (UPF0104 family)
MRGSGTMAAVARVVRPRAGTLAGVALLGLLIWRLGSGPFLRALHVVDGPTLLAAVLIGVVTTVVSAWRWVLVARGLGIRLPLSTAIGSYYRCLFLNAVLPGGVLGDVHRAVRHGRDVGDVALASKAVVLERMAGQVVLLGIGGIVLAAAVLPGRLPDVARTVGTAGSSPSGRLAVAALMVLAALLVAALVWGLRRAGRTQILKAWTAPVRRGLLARGSRTGVLVASGVVLAGHLATFVIAARAAGSVAPVTTLMPLLLLALTAMGLPLNIGGWGPREAATTWAFGAAGLDAGQGLTMAVVYGMFAFAASLPGAAVLISHRVSRLSQVETRATSETRPTNETRPAGGVGVLRLARPSGGTS